jgi:DNA modification methylase
MIAVRTCPELKQVAIDDVRPCKNQARRHPKSQLQKLKALIRHFGQVVPIIVDDQNVIVDGHAIWRAQRELNADEVMVVTVVGRDQTDLRALRLALNRVAEEAAWDNEALRAELRELVSLSFDLDLTGFDTLEINHILEIDLPQVGEATDVIPALQQTAVSAPGDIWLCGRHRVGCGDARDAAFARQVCGSSAVMAFVDPVGNAPLGDFASGKGEPQQQDVIHGGLECNVETQFTDFLMQSLTGLKAVCTPHALIYACTDWLHIADLLATAKLCDLPLMDLCVWGKPEASDGSLYRSQHGMICILRASASQHAEKVELARHGRNRSNLWTYRATNLPASEGQELAGAPHRAPMPVTLVADAIRDATKRGAVVVDTFLGSGTTLIAAEETGRTCVGIEFNPHYLDLAIRRWQTATQQRAVHIERGETFDHCGQRVTGLSEEASRG